MLQPFTEPRPADEPRNVSEVALLQDADRYHALCDALEGAGVYVHRWPLGRWFVSTAHDDAVIDETIDRAENAMEEIGNAI